MTIMISSREYRFTALGDCAVTVSFGHAIEPRIHRRVLALQTSLEQEPIPGLREAVPTYCSVTVYYDPLRVYGHRSFRELATDMEQRLPFDRICDCLSERLMQLEQEEGWNADSLADQPDEVIALPVCYEEEFAPDLEFVARHCGMRVDEVIRLHSAGDYRVYMIGFAPGFPYLGGLSERLAVPRRGTPRPSVAAGSIGIGGGQTGIYPIATPGGWHIIGRTPVSLFDPGNNPPSMLKAGDRLRFKPVSRQEFAAWEVKRR